ncbi:MAG TPA: sulfite exporter TauE/SafE family protein [Actinomycetes bacterium]|nr:sulfite exporter TauE/SafE family protein [Actinomycetes bacterium]
MTLIEVVAILLAGVAAGTINTIVGSGTLITFPTLLAFGYSPIVANISNNIGLVPGGVSGTIGYRRELVGQGGRLRQLAPLSLAGGASGALLLFILPPAAFAAIVPALLAVAVVLVIIQPWMKATLARRRAGREVTPRGARTNTLLVQVGVFLAGAYGGYFGAAQGVLLVGLLGMLLPETLQRINAVKNVLSLVVNGVSTAVFVTVAFDQIDWLVVLLIASGSMIGGVIGARVGRRMPAAVLRAVIVIVGTVAIVKIVTA